MERVRALAEQGLRTVAVASRPWTGATHEVEAADEANLIFEGFCAFADPPKATAAAAIARLAAAGIRLKILSGDDPIVVKRLAGLVGLKADKVLSGADVAELSDDALAVQVQSVDAYGRLAPDQKSRLIKALQSRGAVVGYLGDGINDAPALKIADIGLSVEGACGVAQAAADMILLASDLEVVADGVEEGRRTFANILKYVRMGASSNFGNMLSMAVASLFLPFLPMLPTQILLNNLLYDCSEIGIPFELGAAGRNGAAAGLGHARADPLLGDHGAAVVTVRSADVWRAHLYFPRHADGISDDMVLGIDGDANPGDLHHPHQWAAVEGPSATGINRVVSRCTRDRHGGAVHARWPLVWI